MDGKIETRDDDASRWKEKFLSSIEAHEEEEKRLNQQLTLMKRGLVRVSLAADGLDTDLDKELARLRKALRSEGVDQGLAESVIERLEDSLKHLDLRKSHRLEIFLQALLELSDQLIDSPAPKSVRNELKKYKKNIGERIENYNEHAELVSELAALQRKSLMALAQTRKGADSGFWRNIFSRSNKENTKQNVPGHFDDDVEAQFGTSNNDRDEHESVIIKNIDVENIEKSQFSANTENNITQLYTQTPTSLEKLVDDRDDEDEMELETNVHMQFAEQDSKAIPPGMPPFSKVAETVVSILNNLLSQVHVTERAKAFAIKAKKRLRKGLNWYELAPLLEDIATVVIFAQGDEQKEIAQYLLGLNKELIEIASVIRVAQHDQYVAADATEELDASLRNRVEEMQKEILEATDLKHLKQQIRSHLDNIMQSMDVFKDKTKSTEEEIPLSEELQNLLKRVEKMEQESKSVNVHLQEERFRALTDSLTNLPNREAYSERLGLELARFKRYKAPLVLAVADVDHFKLVNDNYGHLAGDRVLQVVAKTIKNKVRETDFVGRFGGEEFVFLFPETSLDDGLKTVEKIRLSVASCPFHFRDKPVTVTVSFGLAQFAEGDSAEDVFVRADQALYRAKTAGRNQSLIGELIPSSEGDTLFSENN